jgi:hypothetical protein
MKKTMRRNNPPKSRRKLAKYKREKVANKQKSLGIQTTIETL